MKTVKYIFWGILVFYLQFLLAGKFQLLGIIPDLILPFVIYINLKLEYPSSVPLSFFMGLSFDLMYPNLLGLHCISFVILSFIITIFHHNINKEKIAVVFFSVLLLNTIHFGIFFLYHLISGNLAQMNVMIFVFTLIYNTLFSLISIYILILFDSIKLTLNVQ